MYIPITIDLQNSYEYSPYVFGHNLEHTRGCIAGGLSAQMLRNRKFAGRSATCGEGCALGWFGVHPERATYDVYPYRPYTDASLIYTRHLEEPSHRNRNYEVHSLIIQNLSEGLPCGIGQDKIWVQEGDRYVFKTVAKCFTPTTLIAALTNRDGSVIYAEGTLELIPGDWQTTECILSPNTTDKDACLHITFAVYGKVVLGAVSLLPENNFHGMRPDVIEHLKKIGSTMLRWPGGNFAGDYLWKDGLLPVDQRGPLQSLTFHTLPYDYGYDNHEIGTDEFIALCREIGAEPSITINPVWNSPEENAAWVEYCNGSVDTKYGALRASRGHAEPYNVKYWGLGNEMGHAHMEGPKTPQAYAAFIRTHAEAMLKVCPDLNLCSSGPYPSKEWVIHSANPLADISKYVSVHNYFNIFHAELDYSTPEAAKATSARIINGTELFRGNIHETREVLSPDVHISLDEWNTWRTWYRVISPAEGIFAGRMIHMLIQESVLSDTPVCCYFQPVNEGAILVTPFKSSLTPMGQLMAFMTDHQKGKICPVTFTEPLDVLATLCDQVVTITLINTDLDASQTAAVPLKGELTHAELLSVDSLLPHTLFQSSRLAVETTDGQLTFELPPCSAAKIQLRIN